jgi:hypothetical protein
MPKRKPLTPDWPATAPTTEEPPAGPAPELAGLEDPPAPLPSATAILEFGKSCRAGALALEQALEHVRTAWEEGWPLADETREEHMADRFEALLSEEWQGARYTVSDLQELAAECLPGKEQAEWAREILAAAPPPAGAPKGARGRAKGGGR